MSNDINQAFAEMSLKVSRQMAKDAGIKIPTGLTVWRESKTDHGYCEVWSKSNGIVWRGEAWNAADAKGNYIISLIPEDSI